MFFFFVKQKTANAVRISDWSSDVCSSDRDSTQAHSLPSARGNGEPLTGRFSPAAGESFQALATGDNDARFVLASSHGYGFVTRFENLTGRQKAGKSLLSLGRDSGARVLQPAQVAAVDTDSIVAVTSAGHLQIGRAHV